MHPTPKPGRRASAGPSGPPRRAAAAWVARVVLLAPWALLPLLASAAPWRAHEGNSPGWRWLTPPERIEHQRRLRGFETLAECKAYLETHHALLVERARQAGERFVAHSPDTCDRLRTEGRLR